MKPISNILLVLALICYVFLPFYEISLQGGITGLDFTAGVITRTESLRGVTFALIPFICGFFSVALNTLKKKQWSYGSLPLILVWLWFFHTTCNFHEFALVHVPEVTPGDDLGEGFAISGLGSGYIASCVLTCVAMLSSIISLLPFKFNEAIERAVDDTIDKGIEGSRKHIKALGQEVSEGWNKIESKTKKKQNKPVEAQQDNPQPEEPKAPLVDKEDDSRFMPQQPGESNSSELPQSTSTDTEDHSRFMPKE